MSNLGLLEFIKVNPQVVPLTAAKQVTVATPSVFVDRNHGREYHNYSKKVEHNHNSSLKRKTIERKSICAQPGNSSGRNMPVQCLSCLFHCLTKSPFWCKDNVLEYLLRLSQIMKLQIAKTHARKSHKKICLVNVFGNKAYW